MPWFTLLQRKDGTPRAKWIWPHTPTQRTETALFTTTLSIPPEATRLELHLSAEGRYTLWLNNQPDPLGRGPARNDLQHRSLDVYEIDFTDQRPPSGELALWAQVRWWAGPPGAPLAEMPSPLPGFICFLLFFDQHNNLIDSIGTSDDAWLAAPCPGIAGIPIQNIPAFLAIGEAESHSSSGFPKTWRTSKPPAGGGGADSAWQKSVTLADPYFRDDPSIPTGPPSPHGWLIEREVAHPVEQLLPLRHLRQFLPNGSLETLTTLINFLLAPNTKARIRVDLGEQANAYYRLTLKGAGSSAAITSGEVFFIPSSNGGGVTKSFSIDAPPNAYLHPLTDRFLHDAHTPSHRFESAHWRSFRFLDIELTAGDTEATLESLELIQTAYPFEPNFEFEARDASEPGPSDEAQPVAVTLQKIVDISWRTLRCCTWETYMDCPYYEQLQYIGDTRIQCLLTYVTTGDVTLPAQALRAFDRSRFTGGSEGLTLSRYPSVIAQVIPTFSLIYILMIEDYLLHTGDEALVAELRPAIAPILNWFSQFMNPDTGLISRIRYWSFVDWVNGWSNGIPPHNLLDIATPNEPRASIRDASALINLHYLLALQSASRIYERSKSGAGNLYAGRAAVLKQKLYDTFFDPGRGLICDIPVDQGKGKLGLWSQHAQALAILADILSPTEARHALETALDPRNILRPSERIGDEAAGEQGRYLAPATLYFRFYLAEALAKLRMGDHLWPLLEPFRAAINRGSTTWPESLEPSRSECHAWSAWPLYFFARHLLGITPPGADDRTGTAGKTDEKTRIRPLACPPLTYAKGRFIGPRGPIDVAISWPSNGTGGLAVPDIQASGASIEVNRTP